MGDRTRAAALAALTAAVLLLPSVGAAQSFPVKPVRLVVAASPGSGADILARLLAPKLTESLGQQLIVDNRPGTGGNLGAAAVARAAPDGYMLLLMAPAHAISPSLVAKPGYDLMRDFAAISLLTTGHYMLVTHPSMPAKSVKEFLGLARAAPGKLTFGSGGIGNATHLAGVLMNMIAKVDTLHVPYKGAGPARTELLGGQVDFMFHNITAVLPDVESGKLRALAVTGPHRASVAPKVPTMSESGLAGYDITSWFGIVAPAGTPQDLIARMHREFVRAVKLPDIVQPLAALGSEVLGSSPKEYADHLRTEASKWERVIKQAGIRPE